MSFENGFNTTLVRSKRHFSFIMPISESKCYNIMKLPYEERCDYFKNTKDCLQDDVHRYLFCVFGQNAVQLYCYMFFLVICMMYLFIVLGKASEFYFCPALKAVSKLMRISEQAAGVTLLALGNCCPDFGQILNHLDDVSTNGVVFTSVASTSFFVSCFVTGLIIIICPAKLNMFAFLRDTLFLLFALLLIDNFVVSGMTTYKAAAVVSLYFLYLSTVLVDQLLAQYTRNKIRKEISDTLHDEKLDTYHKFSSINFLRKDLLPLENELNMRYSNDSDSEETEIDNQVSSVLSFIEDLEKFQSTMELVDVYESLQSIQNQLPTILEEEPTSKKGGIFHDGKNRHGGEEQNQSAPEDSKESASETKNNQCSPGLDYTCDYKIDEVLDIESSSDFIDAKSFLKIENNEEDKLQMPLDEMSSESFSVFIGAQSYEQVEDIQNFVSEESSYYVDAPCCEKIEDIKKFANNESSSEFFDTQTSEDIFARQLEEIEKNIDDLLSNKKETADETHVPNAIFNDDEHIREKAQKSSHHKTIFRFTEFFHRDSLYEHREILKVLWLQFLISLVQVDWAEYKTFNWFWKAYTVISIPVNIILALIMPKVDLDAPMTGWSKILNCIHFITLPCIVIGFFIHGVKVLNVDLIYFALPWSVLIALLVFMTSKTDEPPFYHKVFYLMSIVGSILVVFIAVRVLGQIMSVVSLTTGISLPFLETTFNTYGYGIGYLVSNIKFAREGYVRMSIASCFGGPMNIVSLGMGTYMLYRCYTNKEGYGFIDATEGSLGKNCYLFTIFGLFLLIVAMVTTNFIARRSIGAFLVITYILGIITICFSEGNLVHSFGTDHSMDVI